MRTVHLAHSHPDLCAWLRAHHLDPDQLSTEVIFHNDGRITFHAIDGTPTTILPHSPMPDVPVVSEGY